MTDDHTRLRATTDGTPALPVLTDEQWAQRQPRRGRLTGRGGPPRGRRPLLVRLGHRAVLATASATIGVSAAILVVHAYDSEDRTSPVTAAAPKASYSPKTSEPVANPDPPEPSDPGEISVRLAAQTILPGASFAARAIESVRARAGVAELRLLLTTRRAAPMRVIVEADGSVLRRRTIRAEGAGVHNIRFADLPAGGVQWRVVVPGERAERGRATIAAPPEVLPVSGEQASPVVPDTEPTPAADPSPAPVSPPRPTSPSTGQKPDRTKQPKGTGGTGGGPPGPRDPDTDGSGPVDPDDL